MINTAVFYPCKEKRLLITLYFCYLYIHIFQLVFYKLNDKPLRRQSLDIAPPKQTCIY